MTTFNLLCHRIIIYFLVYFTTSNLKDKTGMRNPAAKGKGTVYEDRFTAEFKSGVTVDVNLSEKSIKALKRIETGEHPALFCV